MAIIPNTFSGRDDLLKELDLAIAEANAPIRSSGPSLPRLAVLIVQQSAISVLNPIRRMLGKPRLPDVAPSA